MPQWRIPQKLEAQCLRMKYSKQSTRSIYLAIWPGGDGAPVTLPTFNDALNTLILETENDVQRLASENNIPIPPPNNRADRPTLELGERIEEEPLPAEVEFALMGLRKIRSTLEAQIDQLSTEEVPDLPNKDVKAMRAATIASLAGAVNTIVSTEIRAAEARTDRTMKHVAMRIRIQESKDDESTLPSGPPATNNQGQLPAGKQPRTLLMLDMPSTPPVAAKKP